MHKKIIKAFCLNTFLIGIVFSVNVYATDLEINISDEFRKWNSLKIEQKEETMIPKSYNVNVTESILKDINKKEIPNLVNKMTQKINIQNEKINLNNVKSIYENDKYHLSEKIDMRVEHQGITNECWAFTMLKALETNIALKNKERTLKDFSERHMDYATSRSFLNGTNEKGFDREVAIGGNAYVGLAYLTNGQGAVLEEDMPFENNKNLIDLESIDKKVDTIVKDYISLPSILKKYVKDEKGNTKKVTYLDIEGKSFSSNELKEIRNVIKKSIVENGAITAITAANYLEYYNNQENVIASTAYNCNNENLIRDHAITIVGWDDNYKKENFVEGARPSTDGAYIVLNSYGKENFDKGYLYVSYEDCFIEKELYAIKAATKKDYENIYQSDFYGGFFSIGAQNIDTGYYSNIYERESTEKEIINNVGITVTDYVDVEIYINPKNGLMNKENLILIGKNNVLLEPGYHRIEVDETELLGKEFAIVVKQKSRNNNFFFAVEAPIPNSGFSFVESDNNSYYSIDGNVFVNLNELNFEEIDMQKSDVCIKVFTKAKEENTEDIPEELPGDDPIQEPEEVNKIISSEKYLIQNKDICKISENTTLSDFKNNIKSVSEIRVFENDEELTASNEIIKTGMILKLENDEEYLLIVRGDINCDGQVSLTDISKIILHYNETRDYILTDSPLKAADMNVDGKVSLVDVSQIIVLYNSK